MLKSLFKNSRKELTKIINYPTRSYCQSVIRQACFNFTAVFFGKIFQSFIRKAVVQNIVLCLFYFIFNRKAYAAKEKSGPCFCFLGDNLFSVSAKFLYIFKRNVNHIVKQNADFKVVGRHICKRTLKSDFNIFICIFLLIA